MLFSTDCIFLFLSVLESDIDNENNLSIPNETVLSIVVYLRKFYCVYYVCSLKLSNSSIEIRLHNNLQLFFDTKGNYTKQRQLIYAEMD